MDKGFSIEVNMRKPVIFFLFVLTSVFSRAEKKYWVTFTDKAGVSFDPESYFDPAAIEFRTTHEISLHDSTD